MVSRPIDAARGLTPAQRLERAPATATRSTGSVTSSIDERPASPFEAYGAQLVVVPAPAATHGYGYEDLRRDATPVRLDEELTVTVASLLDLERIAEVQRTVAECRRCDALELSMGQRRCPRQRRLGLTIVMSSNDTTAGASRVVYGVLFWPALLRYGPCHQYELEALNACLDRAGGSSPR